MFTSPNMAMHFKSAALRLDGKAPDRSGAGRRRRQRRQDDGPAPGDGGPGAHEWGHTVMSRRSRAWRRAVSRGPHTQNWRPRQA